MAFESAAGYQNLPQGNFSPTIFSKKAQIAFRKQSVANSVTNSDYFGEIADYGDTVRIIKEPTIGIVPYVRGKRMDSVTLDDDEITLTVDQANAFQFQIDDIEVKEAHINWEDMAADRASYELRDAYDTHILSYIYSQLATDGTSANFYGTEASPTGVGYGATQITPLNALAHALRYLDERNVPKEGRYAVVDPAFVEKLQNESSKLLNNDYVNKGALTNGKIGMEIRGCTIYESNNLPTWGTGPDATSGTNGGIVIVGHKSAVATAEQIKKVEKFRSQETFADVTRGLHVFGRKLLRPESLQVIRWNNHT